MQSTGRVQLLSRLDRWWFGVLCGAAGSLVTTLLFLVFMIWAGYIHLDMPSRNGEGAGLSDRKQIAVSGQPLFVMRGSTTIGDELAPLLVRSFLESHEHYTDLRVGHLAASSDSKDQVVVGKSSDGTEHYVQIISTGSKDAPPALANGTADIGMMSSQIKDDPATHSNLATMLKEKFGADPRTVGIEYVIGLDGVAAIVNSANSINEISIPKLAEAFSTATDWAQVGRQTGGRIVAQRRDDKSGTTDVFKALVMGGKPIKLGESFSDSKAIVTAVGSRSAALGYVGVGFIGGQDKIKALKIAPAEGKAAVPPEKFLIKLESYPLSRRLYLYASPLNRRPIVDAFLNYTVSNAADTAIAQSGATAPAIPLNIEAQDNKTATDVVRKVFVDSPDIGRYLSGVGHADQLSTSLRFLPQQDVFDTRALNDIVRLKAYLASTKRPASSLRLIGIAGSGADDATQTSHTDAMRAAAVLHQAGLDVLPDRVVGAGFLPIVPSDSPDAFRRNRRVEIWIGG